MSHRVIPECYRLLDIVTGKLQLVAYEHGPVQNADIPGIKQRLVAAPSTVSPL